jgi:hypothetical protein
VTERATTVDELKLAGMVGLLMRHFEASLGARALPENTQIVIRPLFTWPDGELAVWVTVNTPN